jgi:hypothetical protein
MAGSKSDTYCMPKLRRCGRREAKSNVDVHNTFITTPPSVSNFPTCLRSTLTSPLSVRPNRAHESRAPKNRTANNDQNRPFLRRRLWIRVSVTRCLIRDGRLYYKSLAALLRVCVYSVGKNDSVPVLAVVVDVNWSVKDVVFVGLRDD